MITELEVYTYGSLVMYKVGVAGVIEIRCSVDSGIMTYVITYEDDSTHFLDGAFGYIAKGE